MISLPTNVVAKVVIEGELNSSKSKVQIADLLDLAKLSFDNNEPQIDNKIREPIEKMTDAVHKIFDALIQNSDGLVEIFSTMNACFKQGGADYYKKVIGGSDHDDLENTGCLVKLHSTILSIIFSNEIKQASTITPKPTADAVSDLSHQLNQQLVQNLTSDFEVALGKEIIQQNYSKQKEKYQELLSFKAHCASIAESLVAMNIAINQSQLQHSSTAPEQQAEQQTAVQNTDFSEKTDPESIRKKLDDYLELSPEGVAGEIINVRWLSTAQSKTLTPLNEIRQSITKNQEDHQDEKREVVNDKSKDDSDVKKSPIRKAQ